MDIRDFFASGRRVLLDTKTPRKVAAKVKEADPVTQGPVETDPYRAFSRRVIQDKPKKGEVVKDIKRFIEAAESQL